MLVELLQYVANLMEQLAELILTEVTSEIQSCAFF
jgi:hypothetical protein